MTKRRINPEDREFFALVARAAFANPFSDERHQLNQMIAANSRMTESQAVDEAIGQVRHRILRLEEDGPIRLEPFTPADRDVIQYVLLFNIYHQYNSRFDEFIKRQVQNPGETIKVDFGPELLRAITRYGFSDSAAIKYIAMFFQIRRAFYFIAAGLIGTSDCMRKLRMALWNNIFTCDIKHYERYLWERMEDFSTLLTGPTGCGKGAAAAAIGRSGFIPYDAAKQCFTANFTQTFVSVNLSQFPESLLESELFGHTKGAFTGATSDHKGLFSMCSRYGSVFLDEVGEINAQIQIKLLQVLQERLFSPVGSHDKIRFDGRVIAATNKSIEELMSQGRFREDFYYRLCTDCIVVPSLSQRIQENPRELTELVRHVVATITGQESKELSGIVMDVIRDKLGMDYHWPGNVRELAQCVRRIIIKRDYTGKLPQIVETPTAAHIFKNLRHGTYTVSELTHVYCGLLYSKYPNISEICRRTDLDPRTVKKILNLPTRKNKR